jgi:uncharacterized protein YndB with AHSA1/START domain
MLIRKPVTEVFAAFVDPQTTSRFWFSRGSGVLEPGASVKWDWEMYGFSIDVTVLAFEPNRRILIEWPGDGGPTTVEWLLTDRGDRTTFVSITNSGFSGDGDSMVSQAINSTEGFTFLLAGAKAFLEYGLELNLVPDRHPDGLNIQ